MDIAQQYAKALFEIEKPSAVSLRKALEKRGHIKLLPRIFAEYKKLQLGQKRREQAQTINPGQERTRVLLELYKKLIS